MGLHPLFFLRARTASCFFVVAFLCFFWPAVVSCCFFVAFFGPQVRSVKKSLFAPMVTYAFFFRVLPPEKVAAYAHPLDLYTEY